VQSAPERRPKRKIKSTDKGERKKNSVSHDSVGWKKEKTPQKGGEKKAFNRKIVEKKTAQAKNREVSSKGGYLQKEMMGKV